METFLNGYNSKEMKELVDLLIDSTEEMCEQKRKAIAYLYLKISILTGVSLEELLSVMRGKSLLKMLTI